jgi:uncharacterized heparinase superfamily protein
MRLAAQLKWYRNRLAAMPFAEIRHRCREFATKQLARSDSRGWDAIAISGSLRRIERFNLKELSVPPELLSTLVDESAAVTEGCFNLVGARWPKPSTMPVPPDFWHVDPARGDLFAQRDDYCFDISFRHAIEVPEIKRIWELNRLQFVIPLAATGALKNDNRLAELAIGTMLSWMQGNPPYRGLNWASGIELALRVIAVAIALSLLGCDDLPEPTNRALLRFFFAHARWIERFPSLHSSANNHRIAELAGLLVAYSIAPGTPDDDSQVRRNWNDLLNELDRQLHPDGVGAEQSLGYSAFSVELFLTAAAALGRTGELPQRTVDRLAAWAEFSRWMMDARGATPTIGDFDDCRVIATTQEPEARYVASIVAAVAGVLGRPELSPPAADRSLRDAFFHSTMARGQAPMGLKTFPQGGYSVIRGIDEGRSYVLVLDHGPLGYLSIAAHGHADSLAIWLSLDDQTIIADAGTYLYHSDMVSRRHFRGTSLHNTVTLNASSSSDPAGPFNWTRKAASRLLVAGDSPRPRLVAEHDGYLADYGVRHRRTVHAVNSSDFLITDELIGSSDQRSEAAISFLIDPSCRAELSDKRSAVITKEGKPLLRLTARGLLTAKVVRESDTGLGWISPSFGVKQATDQLLFVGDLAAPSTILLQLI